MRRRQKRLRKATRKARSVLSALRDWIVVELALVMEPNPSKLAPKGRVYGCRSCRSVFEVGARCRPYLHVRHCPACGRGSVVHFDILGLYSRTGESLRDWFLGRNHGKEEDVKKGKEKGRKKCHLKLVTKDGDSIKKGS